jgi:hypothetical protein
LIARFNYSLGYLGLVVEFASGSIDLNIIFNYYNNQRRELFPHSVEVIDALLKTIAIMSIYLLHQ